MNKVAFAAVVASVFFAADAQAAVVDFTNATSSHTFADGTFSYNLGNEPDGFYAYNSSTEAYNGYGQDGEYIVFNQAVEFQSLQVKQFSIPALTFTVSLYDSLNNLLGSQTASPTSSYQTMAFSTSNVTKAVFTTTGGYDAYDDGRRSAWYLVNDVTYGANAEAAAVPEPASWAMFIGGFGLIGGAMRRRKVSVSFA